MKCEDCDGEGHVDCQECNGTGGIFESDEDCPNCDGGKVECEACGGSGVI